MSPDFVPSRTDPAPADALLRLAGRLAEEGTLLSAHVAMPPSPTGQSETRNSGDNVIPALGLLAAAGPNTSAAPGEYSLVVEAVREGYLLHYGSPRLLVGVDSDLALLAGDYLYALGLDRLARLDDPPAVALLADLISLSALCRSESLARASEPLWLATTVALASGETPEIIAAKDSLRALESTADRELWQAAEIAALDSDMGPALLLAAKAIDFSAVNI